VSFFRVIKSERTVENTSQGLDEKRKSGRALGRRVKKIFLVQTFI
jgi:hypothetical protein